MKKTVAVSVILFVLFMGSVFVYGFITKQLKESESTSQNTTQSTSPSTNPLNESQSTTNSSTTNVSSTFTAAQVATHSKPADCWLIISGKVYNITNFLDQHPGGADVILPYCGKDATQAFDTQGGRRRGHSNSARQQLAEFQVGTLQ
jgi:cytochrome b involved in lipid metabolism